MLVLFAETSAASAATFLPIYFIPLFFQFVHSDSALEAGVRLLPFVVFLVVACVANGAIMSATGYYFPWYIIAGVLNIVGASLMYTVTEYSSTASIYGYTVLIGIGCGAFIQSSFAVAQAKVDPKYIPSVIGFITAGQISGATISLAIANSVFLNHSTTSIAKILPNVPMSDIQAAISGAGSAFIKGLDAATREKVLHAIVESMSKVYILTITAGSVALVLAFLMKPGDKLFMKPGAGA